MDFQKTSKPYFAYLRVLGAQKQCSKFQNCGLSTKKVTKTQKCTQVAWPPRFLLIFNILWQLWGVITFERIISLCWNFQDNLISYTPFISKSSIRIWDGSCPNLLSHIKLQTWQSLFPHDSDLPGIWAFGNFARTKWSFRLLPLRNPTTGISWKTFWCSLSGVEEYVILVKYFLQFEKPVNMWY